MHYSEGLKTILHVINEPDRCDLRTLESRPSSPFRRVCQLALLTQPAQLTEHHSTHLYLDTTIHHVSSKHPQRLLSHLLASPFFAVKTTEEQSHGPQATCQLQEQLTC